MRPSIRSSPTSTRTAPWSIRTVPTRSCLPLALAEGPSEYRTAEVTPHLTTNIAVIRRFVERDIVCEGEEGGPGRVRIA